MTPRIEWTLFALDRVDSLTEFIARKNPEAATRAINELFERVAMLADQPEIGHVVEALGEPSIRQMYFGIYRVICLVDRASAAVLILAVQHGREAPYSPDEIEDLASAGVASRPALPT